MIGLYPHTVGSWHRLLSVLLLLLTAGCQSLYFQPVGPPPEEPLAYRVDQLPFPEYWTGLVFNGDKIGYTHFALQPVAGAEARYEIRSEASFVLRFLGIEKKIHLKARDIVDDRLALLDFDYDYRIDDSTLVIKGRRSGTYLEVAVASGGDLTRTRIALDQPLYPASVIALYPVVHGIRPGKEYAYRVYDGQLQTVAAVRQRVEAYESSTLFSGNAFRISTAMHGQRTTTWIDHSGRPVFELALRGVMISALEEEAVARQYVALAALNRQEALIEFSLIRPDAEVPAPREVTYMRATISGLDSLPPDGSGQRCSRRRQHVDCEIATTELLEAPSPVAARYLDSSATVQTGHISIRTTANEIAAGSRDPGELVGRLIDWMQLNIERAPLDVFSALDVLQQRKAECQGHAYLYVALARALGIPTRMVSGLVYSGDLKGFLYHSWAESLVAGRWRAVDPTFGQTVADATHIKLVEGEELKDLLPLARWVGQLEVRVLALQHATR